MYIRVYHTWPWRRIPAIHMADCTEPRAMAGGFRGFRGNDKPASENDQKIQEGNRVDSSIPERIVFQWMPASANMITM